MGTDLLTALRPLGTELVPALFEGTLGLFAPLAPRPTPDVCAVERDIAYGSDVRHRMDIFHPPAGITTAGQRAVVVFVHGGGFVRGDKGAPEAPFYNNVGAWAVLNGLIGVTITYRLAPDSRWPAGAEDVASALEWLAANVAQFGADPARLFLMGQSAGAVHVAGYVTGQHGRAAPRVAGAMMLSGIYDVLSLKRSAFEDAYFGAERELSRDPSTLTGLVTTDTACLFTVSELDPPTFQQQASRLVAAHWETRGRLPRLLYQQAHNHLSPILQLGTPYDTLGGELLAFMRRVPSGTPAQR